MFCINVLRDSCRLALVGIMWYCADLSRWRRLRNVCDGLEVLVNFLSSSPYFDEVVTKWSWRLSVQRKCTMNMCWGPSCWKAAVESAFYSWVWPSSSKGCPGGCGVSILGGTQKPSGHGRGQLGLGVPVWAGIGQLGLQRFPCYLTLAVTLWNTGSVLALETGPCCWLVPMSVQE